MAVVLKNQESAGTAHRSTTSPLTWSFANTTGTKLYVGAIVTGTFGAASIGAVTYNGVAMTLEKQFTFTDGLSTMAIYSLDSAPQGTFTVSISGSAGTLIAILGAAISFTGVATGTSTNTTTGKDETGTATSASVTLAGTTNGNYVIAVGGTGSGWGSSTVPTQISAKLNGSVNTESDNIVLTEQSTSGGSVTVQMSLTQDLWGMAVIEVQAPAAGTKQQQLPMTGVGS